MAEGSSLGGLAGGGRRTDTAAQKGIRNKSLDDAAAAAATAPFGSSDGFAFSDDATDKTGWVPPLAERVGSETKFRSAFEGPEQVVVVTKSQDSTAGGTSGFRSGLPGGLTFDVTMMPPPAAGIGASGDGEGLHLGSPLVIVCD